MVDAAPLRQQRGACSADGLASSFDRDARDLSLGSIGGGRSVGAARFQTAG